MIKKLFFIATMALASGFAQAYECTGPVQGVTIEPGTGDILVKSVAGFSWPRMCSVKAEFNGISPESCKVIYSTLLSAQVAEKNVTLWFNDNGNCLPTSQTAFYALTGWHFGPSIE